MKGEVGNGWSKAVDRTPLMQAARSGRSEVAKVLLEKGADANTTNGIGATPLMLAAIGGHVERRETNRK